jgi:predicted DNA-binding transcriptional regulator YafY
MKLDRLLGILNVLLQNDRVTAPELAEKFEVNRRTVGRDIDTLCQAGIPIVTKQGIGGGISIAEGFKSLNKLHANTDAVVSTREPVIIDLASHYKSQLTGKIELIKRAILKTRLIEFDYYYEKGESRRRIEPYFVIFQWTSWYVFGYCEKRQDWRMFKLLRLWNLSLCDESYTPREIPPERRDFGTNFPDDINLVALFDPSERYKLVESYGLNCYTETDEGLRIEIGFTNRDFLISWLLGFGGKVKVLEPDYIAKDIKTIAKNILARYK